jgi:hypothetical protein
MADKSAFDRLMAEKFDPAADHIAERAANSAQYDDKVSNVTRYFEQKVETLRQMCLSGENPVDYYCFLLIEPDLPRHLRLEVLTMSILWTKWPWITIDKALQIVDEMDYDNHGQPTEYTQNFREMLNAKRLDYPDKWAHGELFVPECEDSDEDVHMEDLPEASNINKIVQEQSSQEFDSQETKVGEMESPVKWSQSTLSNTSPLKALGTKLSALEGSSVSSQETGSPFASPSKHAGQAHEQDPEEPSSPSGKPKDASAMGPPKGKGRPRRKHR